MNILHPSPRKIAIFIVLFALILVFLPTVKCRSGEVVAKKVCDKIGFCFTDVYVSPVLYFVSGCEEMVGLPKLIILSVVLVVSCYMLSCVIDWLYLAYRDI